MMNNAHACTHRIYPLLAFPGNVCIVRKVVQWKIARLFACCVEYFCYCHQTIPTSGELNKEAVELDCNTAILTYIAITF